MRSGRRCQIALAGWCIVELWHRKQHAPSEETRHRCNLVALTLRDAGFDDSARQRQHVLCRNARGFEQREIPALEGRDRIRFRLGGGKIALRRVGNAARVVPHGLDVRNAVAGKIRPERHGSPPSGSILITSAPRSPSSLPQNWPVSFASSAIRRWRFPLGHHDPGCALCPVDTSDRQSIAGFATRSPPRSRRACGWAATYRSAMTRVTGRSSSTRPRRTR